ncbi:MAG: Uma2 family endonuclease [Caldilineaceae bacterium]
MSANPKIYVTPVEYLTGERKREFKSEYWNGEVYAMAGASERHNLISLNVAAELRAQLRKRTCRAYSSDMRVKISATGLYTYPDVVVVCGKPQFEDEDNDTLLNPTVLVEVLSKSTESYDRGKKFENYRTLDSLTEYLLIAQDRSYIEHYVRQADNQWLLSEAKALEDVIELPTIECKLALADVYDKVDFQSRPRALRESDEK